MLYFAVEIGEGYAEVFINTWWGFCLEALFNLLCWKLGVGIHQILGKINHIKPLLILLV